MKILYLLILVPGLVLAGGNNKNAVANASARANAEAVAEASVGDIVVNNGGPEINVDGPEVNVKTNLKAGDVDVRGGDVSFNDAPSAAYSYAAQCGVGGGVSTMDFSASVTGETQYCKHLRMSSFYEGLYREALSRKDNIMAQVWFNAMVLEIDKSQTLVDATKYTGAAKEVAGDLLLPTLLCGGLGVAATPAAGYICAAGLIGKSVYDVDQVEKSYNRKKDALEIRNTEHTDCAKVTCTYVDGELHYVEN